MACTQNVVAHDTAVASQAGLQKHHTISLQIRGSTACAQAAGFYSWQEARAPDLPNACEQKPTQAHASQQMKHVVAFEATAAAEMAGLPQLLTPAAVGRSAILKQ